MTIYIRHSLLQAKSMTLLQNNFPNTLCIGKSTDISRHFLLNNKPDKQSKSVMEILPWSMTMKYGGLDLSKAYRPGNQR